MILYDEACLCAIGNSQGSPDTNVFRINLDFNVHQRNHNLTNGAEQKVYVNTESTTKQLRNQRSGNFCGK